jgi:hypothetical protein
METQSISAVFDRMIEAESAVGRLEVAGIPAADITVLGPDPLAADIPRIGRTVVTACVEMHLIDKALAILAGEGHVDGQVDGQLANQ